ncbi:unnamed protein product [Trichogramma brassicae]|uniref:Uncharacterized protein n=1 Tax=Trichogramma brassicae TaxID=86971 RepID=A0A6H5HWZ4_9HYME|nr:unnamed protein product [Trichogramma brassicae]
MNSMPKDPAKTTKKTRLTSIKPLLYRHVPVHRATRHKSYRLDGNILKILEISRIPRKLPTWRRSIFSKFASFADTAEATDLAEIFSKFASFADTAEATDLAEIFSKSASFADIAEGTDLADIFSKFASFADIAEGTDSACTHSKFLIC